MDCCVEQCEMCQGLRCHTRIKDRMFEEFNDEYKQAQREFRQITALFREVCWYNFETKCRNWNAPWPLSVSGSQIEMHTHRHVKQWKSGRYIEHVIFPIWYSGRVSDAPLLPPDIIFVEMKKAQEYMLQMEQQRFAPYDYAPGGRMYEKLLREGEGALAYAAKHKSSKCVISDDDRRCGKQTRKRRLGHQQCDLLGGQTET